MSRFGLFHLTIARGPSLISPTGTEILPWPSTVKEPRGDPLDTIDGTFDLGAAIRRCAHGTRQRHNTVLPTWLGRDGNRPPRTEPRGSCRVVNRQLLLPRLKPLRRLRLLLVWTLQLLLEQPLQLLLPLLKLLQLSLPMLLQLLLELHLLLLLLLLPLLCLLLLLLHQRLLLLLLPVQTVLLLLFFFYFFFFFFLPLLFPPPSLLLILLLLLLDRVEPNGPQCPSLGLGSLNPLVRDMSACRAWAFPGLITNSDGVAHSPQLGWLGGSLLTLGARRLALSGG